jgi:Na+/melibiose symporter-like transporter
LSALFFITPESSSTLIIVIAVHVGLGMGISYAIPWAMLPEVVDVDELVSGERKEGVYAGVMTFLRQTSSSLAVFAIGAILQTTGYNADLAFQPPSAVNAIRLINTVIPIVTVFLGILSCWWFPITRNNFAMIRDYLDKLYAGQPISEDEQMQIDAVIARVHGVSSKG